MAEEEDEDDYEDDREVGEDEDESFDEVEDSGYYYEDDGENDEGEVNIDVAVDFQTNTPCKPQRTKEQDINIGGQLVENHLVDVDR